MWFCEGPGKPESWKATQGVCSWKRVPREFVFLIYPYLWVSMLYWAEEVHIRVNWNLGTPNFQTLKNKKVVSFPAVGISVGFCKIYEWILSSSLMLFHNMLHFPHLNCQENNWSLLSCQFCSMWYPLTWGGGWLSPQRESYLQHLLVYVNTTEGVYPKINNKNKNKNKKIKIKIK